MKAAGEASKTTKPQSPNPATIPDMNNIQSVTTQPGYGPRRDDVPLEPVHYHRSVSWQLIKYKLTSDDVRREAHPRKPEHDRQSYQHPAYAQEYPRGEDRSSQYSWDPLPRKGGEESRMHSTNYGQYRR